MSATLPAAAAIAALPARRRRSWRSGREGSPVVFYLALSAGALVWISPIFLLLMTATKSAAEFSHGDTFALPQTIEWGNFARAWAAGVKTYFFNSLLMTVIKVPVGVVIAAMAAFALSCMPMRGARPVFFLFLIGLVVPVQMALVPLTILLRNLGLLDSLFGLFWLYLGFGLPFGILVLRGYMRTLPPALIEAAVIDGCGWFGVFWRIILPLSKPAIVALLIFDGISTWNEFILAQIFLRTDTMRTLPLGLVNFQTEFSTAYELLAAAQCITIAPLVIVYLIFQRHFVSGLAGSVKG
jgi:raffinose/stachyose/melibiose transport system permease protein